MGYPECRHLALGPATLARDHVAVDHAFSVWRDGDLTKGMHGAERVQHRRNGRGLRCGRIREHAVEEYGSCAATQDRHAPVHAMPLIAPPTSRRSSISMPRVPVIARSRWKILIFRLRAPGPVLPPSPRAIGSNHSRAWNCAVDRRTG